MPDDRAKGIRSLTHGTDRAALQTPFPSDPFKIVALISRPTKTLNLPLMRSFNANTDFIELRGARSQFTDLGHSLIPGEHRRATGEQNTSRVSQTICIGWPRPNHKFCLQ